MVNQEAFHGRIRRWGGGLDHKNDLSKVKECCHKRFRSECEKLDESKNTKEHQVKNCFLALLGFLVLACLLCTYYVLENQASLKCFLSTSSLLIYWLRLK